MPPLSMPHVPHTHFVSMPILCLHCVCSVNADYWKIFKQTGGKVRNRFSFNSAPPFVLYPNITKRKLCSTFSLQIFNVMKEDAIKAPTRLPNQYLLVQCSYGNIRRICEIFNDVVLVSLLLTLNIILVFPLMNLNKQIPAE